MVEERSSIPPTGIGMGITLDTQELYGSGADAIYTEDFLRNAHAGELLFAVSRLLAVFNPSKPNSSIIRSVRGHLSTLSLGNDFLWRAERLVNEGRIPNAPQVMLTVAKQVLGRCNEALKPPRMVDDPEPLWRALWLGAVASWMLGKNVSLVEDVQNGVFHKHRETGPILQRAYECYSVLSRDRSRFPPREFMDIPALFERATGIGLDTFLSVITAISMAYHPVRIEDPEEFLWTSYWAKDLSTLLTPFGADATRILDRLTVDSFEFRAGHIGSLRHAWDFEYFRKKPLIRLEKLYFPVYGRFLLDYLWDGVFWIIADSLDKDKKRRFQGFFGRVFEEYCKDLLRSVDRKGGRVVSEFRYNKDSMSPDAFIVCGSDLIVIEFKAKRLKLRDTLVHGNRISFLEDIRKLFVEPARQVHGHLMAMKRRGTTEPITMSAIKRIHAVVVTQGSFAGLRQTYEAIDKDLLAAGLYDDLPIAGWHLFDIDEFESFVGLGDQGENLVHVLDRKSEGALRYLSFSDFLAGTAQHIAYPAVIQQRGKSFTGQLVATLTGHSSGAAPD